MKIDQILGARCKTEDRVCENTGVECLIDKGRRGIDETGRNHRCAIMIGSTTTDRKARSCGIAGHRSGCARVRHPVHTQGSGYVRRVSAAVDVENIAAHDINCAGGCRGLIGVDGATRADRLHHIVVGGAAGGRVVLKGCLGYARDNPCCCRGGEAAGGAAVHVVGDSRCAACNPSQRHRQRGGRNAGGGRKRSIQTDRLHRRCSPCRRTGQDARADLDARNDRIVRDRGRCNCDLPRGVGSCSERLNVGNIRTARGGSDVKVRQRRRAVDQDIEDASIGGYAHPIFIEMKIHDIRLAGVQPRNRIGKRTVVHRLINSLWSGANHSDGNRNRRTIIALGAAARDILISRPRRAGNRRTAGIDGHNIRSDHAARCRYTDAGNIRVRNAAECLRLHHVVVSGTVGNRRIRIRRGRVADSSH